ncbi:hemerythrin domain-containing protein [Nocardioides sp. JQ2195]|uniref:hemerythrin domain-containing protein n=1 Tax=Nocardioides sp. JQ2195 TaxID=2592334 RepID=UPI00143EC3D1|nr:hemerythrin domain-containing protein [Nocardioides sp. JQ2195]QIX27138.1 hemerythrin domain-containing protein [Nocardioides sp. JQ2195]
MNLSEALIREHHEIDAGIEEFVNELEADNVSAQPLLTALAALRRHIHLEETILFPPLRQGGLMMPVMVMLREHGELWSVMDALAVAVSAEEPDLEQLRELCGDLLARLDAHNSKEEPIIYPHAESDLPEDAAAELADFIDNGTLPGGWVCEGAR